MCPSTPSPGPLQPLSHPQGDGEELGCASIRGEGQQNEGGGRGVEEGGCPLPGAAREVSHCSAWGQRYAPGLEKGVLRDLPVPFVTGPGYLGSLAVTAGVGGDTHSAGRRSTSGQGQARMLSLPA